MSQDQPRVWIVLVLSIWNSWMCGAALGQERQPPDDEARLRVREAGIIIGTLPTGPSNTITDVADVRVGHQTMIAGDATRTGVTAVIPHGGNLYQQKVPAAIVVGNGFGKLIGSTQVDELGVLETPILLTNTLSAFAAADALVAYTLRQSGNESVVSVNPVVGECNDAYLNDIRAQQVDREAVYRAIAAARTDVVAEGAVGAGTGTRCLGWKGGIGTASRRVQQGDAVHTVGVLVQTNFGGSLVVAGVPVGRIFADSPPAEIPPNTPDPPKPAETAGDAATTPDSPAAASDTEAGSCIIIVATDAPLNSRQLKRVARRALLALPLVGAHLSHGSGDYVIAFSTHPGLRTAATAADETTVPHQVLRDDVLNPLFIAAREATEEAILNSLFQAKTITGHQGHTVQALPVQRVVEVCRARGLIAAEVD